MDFALTDTIELRGTAGVKLSPAEKDRGIKHARLISYPTPRNSQEHYQDTNARSARLFFPPLFSFIGLGHFKGTWSFILLDKKGRHYHNTTTTTLQLFFSLEKEIFLVLSSIITNA